MIVIAEHESRTQPHRVGPGAAEVHTLAQRPDEAPDAFATRVLAALRDADDGGLLIFAGGPRYDRAIQSARTRILDALARRGVATGAAIGVDATGVTGPSRHSLVALADAFSLVGPREGVMLLDRAAARPAAQPAARPSAMSSARSSGRRPVEVRTFALEVAPASRRVAPSRTPNRTPKRVAAA